MTTALIRPEPGVDDERRAARGSDPVRTYLTGIGRTPLLTAEQEVRLAKRIEAGLYAAAVLAHSRDGTDPPLPADLRADLETVAREGAEAKNHMVEANLRLVVSIATRYTKSGIPLVDLIQEGNLGLIHAVEKFDYTPGFRFSTYATWWIRQAITRALGQQARVIRIPPRVLDRINRLLRTRHELSDTLGRRPHNDEIAENLDLPTTQVVELLSYCQEPVSLDQPAAVDSDTPLGELIQLSGPDDHESDSAALPRDRLDELLATLKPQEQRVIRLRYGLDDGRQRTLHEVGKECGVTRERIRQVEKRTLEKLRALVADTREAAAATR
ncbi:sigma-70 family RNA polymerase sigma factor [Qaidamihabitans albus]|uniref:sigma-70 family RNA polymerase sigma factor n=1 Tax=Qaidamihabitans albus TaxID=2795733 RepID=UPI0027DE61D5|nr:sigma-70 family RNA polymerase sigma factor [Qaidamihabitans albus]